MHLGVEFQVICKMNLFCQILYEDDTCEKIIFDDFFVTYFHTESVALIRILFIILLIVNNPNKLLLFSIIIIRFFSINLNIFVD